MTHDRRHLVLRPGLRLARRCDGLLQAGLTRPHRAGLADSPLARRLAIALRHFDQTVPEGTDEMLADLSALLMDGRALLGLLRSNEGQEGSIAALAHEHGNSTTRLWRRRAEVRVQVSGPGSWCDLARHLLKAHGLTIAGARDPADVHLLLHVGEPESGRADEMLRTGTAHVWAGTSAGEVAVGPFVDPGRTPCRRCVIAALSSVDPGHALVREQYVGRDGDLPEPEDPSLLTMAIAWSVREIVAWVDGITPTTWGTTVVLPRQGAPRERRFLRQPECGCSWTGAWLAG